MVVVVMLARSPGLLVVFTVFFLRCSIMHTPTPSSKHSPARPPTTPPTMAPTGGPGAGVGDGEEPAMPVESAMADNVTGITDVDEPWLSVMVLYEMLTTVVDPLSPAPPSPLLPLPSSSPGLPPSLLGLSATTGVTVWIWTEVIVTGFTPLVTVAEAVTVTEDLTVIDSVFVTRNGSHNQQGRSAIT